MPIVRISSTLAPVGSSRPDNRIGTTGVAIDATRPRHAAIPSPSSLVIDTVAA